MNISTLQRFLLDKIPRGNPLYTKLVKWRLDSLSKQPQQSHPQRSTEWLESRKGILTASQIPHLLNPNPRLKGSNAALVHGMRFESLALKYYEMKQNVSVRNFGLVLDDEYPWIGASIDGVTSDGTIVEIKCPYQRIIPSKPCQSTYDQVQIQMRVFGLPYADIVQARFVEYANLDDLMHDSEQRLFVGMAIDSGNGNTLYGPCKFDSTFKWRKNLVDWSLKQVLLLDQGIPVPYYLHSFSVERVKRDPQWFNDILPRLREFHEKKVLKE